MMGSIGALDICSFEIFHSFDFIFCFAFYIADRVTFLFSFGCDGVLLSLLGGPFSSEIGIIYTVTRQL